MSLLQVAKGRGRDPSSIFSRTGRSRSRSRSRSNSVTRTNGINPQAGSMTSTWNMSDNPEGSSAASRMKWIMGEAKHQPAVDGASKESSNPYFDVSSNRSASNEGRSLSARPRDSSPQHRKGSPFDRRNDAPSGNDSDVPVKEIRATSAKKGRRLSIGQSLSIEFDYTMPVDKVQLQRGREFTVKPVPAKSASPNQSPARTRASKLLDRLDNKHGDLRHTSLSPQRTRPFRGVAAAVSSTSPLRPSLGPPTTAHMTTGITTPPLPPHSRSPSPSRRTSISSISAPTGLRSRSKWSSSKTVSSSLGSRAELGSLPSSPSHNGKILETITPPNQSSSSVRTKPSDASTTDAAPSSRPERTSNAPSANIAATGSSAGHSKAAVSRGRSLSPRQPSDTAPSSHRRVFSNYPGSTTTTDSRKPKSKRKSKRSSSNSSNRTAKEAAKAAAARAILNMERKSAESTATRTDDELEARLKEQGARNKGRKEQQRITKRAVEKALLQERQSPSPVLGQSAGSRPLGTRGKTSILERLEKLGLKPTEADARVFKMTPTPEPTQRDPSNEMDFDSDVERISDAQLLARLAQLGIRPTTEPLPVNAADTDVTKEARMEQSPEEDSDAKADGEVQEILQHRPNNTNPFDQSEETSGVLANQTNLRSEKAATTNPFDDDYDQTALDVDGMGDEPALSKTPSRNPFDDDSEPNDVVIDVSPMRTRSRMPPVSTNPFDSHDELDSEEKDGDMSNVAVEAVLLSDLATRNPFAEIADDNIIDKDVFDVENSVYDHDPVLPDRSSTATASTELADRDDSNTVQPSSDDRVESDSKDEKTTISDIPKQSREPSLCRVVQDEVTETSNELNILSSEISSICSSVSTNNADGANLQEPVAPSGTKIRLSSSTESQGQSQTEGQAMPTPLPPESQLKPQKEPEIMQKNLKPDPEPASADRKQPNPSPPRLQSIEVLNSTGQKKTLPMGPPPLSPASSISSMRIGRRKSVRSNDTSPISLGRMAAASSDSGKPDTPPTFKRISNSLAYSSVSSMPSRAEVEGGQNQQSSQSPVVFSSKSPEPSVGQTSALEGNSVNITIPSFRSEASALSNDDSAAVRSKPNNPPLASPHTDQGLRHDTKSVDKVELERKSLADDWTSPIKGDVSSLSRTEGEIVTFGLSQPQSTGSTISRSNLRPLHPTVNADSPQQPNHVDEPQSPGQDQSYMYPPNFQWQTFGVTEHMPLHHSYEFHQQHGPQVPLQQDLDIYEQHDLETQRMMVQRMQQQLQLYPYQYPYPPPPGSNQQFQVPWTANTEQTSIPQGFFHTPNSPFHRSQSSPSHSHFGKQREEESNHRNDNTIPFDPSGISAVLKPLVDISFNSSMQEHREGNGNPTIIHTDDIGQTKVNNPHHAGKTTPDGVFANVSDISSRNGAIGARDTQPYMIMSTQQQQHGQSNHLRTLQAQPPRFPPSQPLHRPEASNTEASSSVEYGEPSLCGLWSGAVKPNHALEGSKAEPNLVVAGEGPTGKANPQSPLTNFPLALGSNDAVEGNMSNLLRGDHNRTAPNNYSDGYVSQDQMMTMEDNQKHYATPHHQLQVQNSMSDTNTSQPHRAHAVAATQDVPMRGCLCPWNEHRFFPGESSEEGRSVVLQGSQTRATREDISTLLTSVGFSEVPTVPSEIAYEVPMSGAVYDRYDPDHPTAEQTMQKVQLIISNISSVSESYVTSSFDEDSVLGKIIGKGADFDTAMKRGRKMAEDEGGRSVTDLFGSAGTDMALAQSSLSTYDSTRSSNGRLSSLLSKFQATQKEMQDIPLEEQGGACSTPKGAEEPNKEAVPAIITAVAHNVGERGGSAQQSDNIYLGRIAQMLSDPSVSDNTDDLLMTFTRSSDKSLISHQNGNFKKSVNAAESGIQPKEVQQLATNEKEAQTHPNDSSATVVVPDRVEAKSLGQREGKAPSTIATDGKNDRINGNGRVLSTSDYEMLGINERIIYQVEASLSTSGTSISKSEVGDAKTDRYWVDGGGSPRASSSSVVHSLTTQSSRSRKKERSAKEQLPQTTDNHGSRSDAGSSLTITEVTAKKSKTSNSGHGYANEQQTVEAAEEGPSETESEVVAKRREQEKNVLEKASIDDGSRSEADSSLAVLGATIKKSKAGKKAKSDPAEKSVADDGSSSKAQSHAHIPNRTLPPAYQGNPNEEKRKRKKKKKSNQHTTGVDDGSKSEADLSLDVRESNETKNFDKKRRIKNEHPTVRDDEGEADSTRTKKKSDKKKDKSRILQHDDGRRSAAKANSEAASPPDVVEVRRKSKPDGTKTSKNGQQTLNVIDGSVAGVQDSLARKRDAEKNENAKDQGDDTKKSSGNEQQRLEEQKPKDKQQATQNDDGNALVTASSSDAHKTAAVASEAESNALPLNGSKTDPLPAFAGTFSQANAMPEYPKEKNQHQGYVDANATNRREIDSTLMAVQGSPIERDEIGSQKAAHRTGLQKDIATLESEETRSHEIQTSSQNGIHGGKEPSSSSDVDDKPDLSSSFDHVEEGPEDGLDSEEKSASPQSDTAEKPQHPQSVEEIKKQIDQIADDSIKLLSILTGKPQGSEITVLASRLPPPVPSRLSSSTLEQTSEKDRKIKPWTSRSDESTSTQLTQSLSESSGTTASQSVSSLGSQEELLGSDHQKSEVPRASLENDSVGSMVPASSSVIAAAPVLSKASIGDKTPGSLDTVAQVVRTFPEFVPAGQRNDSKRKSRSLSPSRHSPIPETDSPRRRSVSPWNKSQVAKHRDASVVNGGEPTDESRSANHKVEESQKMRFSNPPATDPPTMQEKEILNRVQIQESEAGTIPEIQKMKDMDAVHSGSLGGTTTTTTIASTAHLEQKTRSSAAQKVTRRSRSFPKLSSDPPSDRSVGSTTSQESLSRQPRTHEGRRRKGSSARGRSLVERDARVKAVLERIERRKSESVPTLRTPTSRPVALGISISPASSKREKRDKVKVDFQTPFSKPQQARSKTQDAKVIESKPQRSRDPPMTRSRAFAVPDTSDRFASKGTTMESTIHPKHGQGNIQSRSSPQKARVEKSAEDSSEVAADSDKQILEKINNAVGSTRQERQLLLKSMQKKANSGKQDPPSFTDRRRKDWVAQLYDLERKPDLSDRSVASSPRSSSNNNNNTSSKRRVWSFADSTTEVSSASNNSNVSVDPFGSSLRTKSPGRKQIPSPERRASGSWERSTRRTLPISPERSCHIKSRAEVYTSVGTVPRLRKVLDGERSAGQTTEPVVERRTPSGSPRGSSTPVSSRHRHASPIPESSRPRQISADSRRLAVSEGTGSPLSSPEKRRLLGKYGEQTQSIRRQVDLAIRTSSEIRTKHCHLSEELRAFRQKVSQHSSCKRGEMEIMEACRSELGEFKRHVEQARQKGQDNSLRESWDSLSDVRSVMLSNLKLMHGAKEALLHSGIPDLADDDHRRLDDIQKTMETIRERERFDSQRVKECLADAKRLIKRTPSSVAAAE